MKHLLILGSILLLFSCGTAPSSDMQSSWTNSESSVKLNNLSKVVVIAMTSDTSVRRQLEDAFVSQLGGKGTPSYSVLTGSLQNVNANLVSQQLNSDGFDGAIVLRLENHQRSGSKRKGSVSVQPSVYMNFHGNIGGGIGVGINPGYNTLKDQYSISTSVYQLPKDNILWSGSSMVTNPDNVSKMSNEMASQVFSQMRKDGFAN